MRHTENNVRRYRLNAADLLRDKLLTDGILKNPDFKRLGTRDECIINELPHKVTANQRELLLKMLEEFAQLAEEVYLDFKHGAVRYPISTQRWFTFESDAKCLNDADISSEWMYKWNLLDSYLADIHQVLSHLPLNYYQPRRK